VGHELLRGPKRPRDSSIGDKQVNHAQVAKFDGHVAQLQTWPMGPGQEPLDRDA
jgi:hypothetical protein